MSRAFRLLGAGRAEMVDVPRPEPGPDEVLLRVLAAGVCRTDLALLRGGGADGVTLPVTLGHEVGGLGHLAVQLLRATSEVRGVHAVDVDRARLDFAAEIGADDGIAAGPGAAEDVLAANAGRKVDAVFDFVGTQESLDLAAEVTRRGGGIVVTGGGGGRLSITARMGAGGAPDPRDRDGAHPSGAPAGISHGRSRSPRRPGSHARRGPRPRGRRSGACRSGRRERARARRARALRKGESHVVSCDRTD
jgi:threonine dehydrogenase-like Zn-dependent dehydrogenase